MADENARIARTQLGREDHGIPTCWLMLEGPGWGQGFGGYDLRYSAYGIDFVQKILDTLKVTEWEKLPGTYCRIRRTNGFTSKITAIGHITEERWFDPERDLKSEPRG